MRFARSFSPLALVIATVGAPSWAAQDDPHHPAGAAPAIASKSTPVKPSAEMTRMDMQIKDMQQMHGKMMAATTPEERTALMAEQMKTMQAGMTMMNSMPQAGVDGMKGDMATHDQMMEKRMQMMQGMMQMMMDRLPAAPAK